MTSSHDLWLTALRVPADFALHATKLVAVAPASIRERAPTAVTKAETLDFKTLTPEPGGLFDFKVFGAGTVIDAPPVDDDAPYKPRRTRFGRLALPEPIVHPLALAHAADHVAARAGWTRAQLDEQVAGDDPAALIAALVARDLHDDLVISELPVVPPEWRPLTRLDDDRWQSSAINDHYRRVIGRIQRWVRSLSPNTPTAATTTVVPIAPITMPGRVIPMTPSPTSAPIMLPATEQRELSAALVALYENEDRAAPVVAANKPLGSLRGLVGGTAGLFGALAELDARGGNLDGAPARVHRAAAMLFALGLELVAT